MPVIRLQTEIAAPPERCFDLSLDVEVHQQSTAASNERAVDGVTTGRLRLGESVTWEATHLWVRLRLTTCIVQFDRPHRFVDEMVKGPFKRLRHQHDFLPTGPGTLMTDTFDFASPLGILGWSADALVLRRYLRRLLKTRNEFLKQTAENRAA